MKIAIDLGGTVIKVSSYLDNNPDPIWFETLDAHSNLGIEQALTRAEDIIRRHANGNPTCIGIASPGIVDSDRCLVTYINGKFEDAVGFDFASWCKQHFSCDLVMINDANAALLGEVAYGCAVGYTNAVMLIIGTGVGTSAMMDGKLVRGVHNQAGILGGHFIVNPFGRGCSCGAVGCLETYAGSREIIYQAEADRNHKESAIFKERPITMKGIASCWEKGDEYATKIITTAIGYYSAAAVNLIHAYDPECVILSGGLTGSKEIVKEIQKNVYFLAWLPWGQPDFRHAENPERSVSLGLLKVMHEHEHT